MDRASVLVVDDEAPVVEMLREGLQADDLRVLTAGDGAEALRILAAEHVDVVVLDIMMPRVDGWMTLMEIRSNPATADLPVIMLSGKTEDLAKTLAFRQGAQQYVSKPFSVMELAARVRSLVVARARAGEARTRDGEIRKLAVRKGGRTVLVDIDDIIFASARNKSTYVHTFENQYLIDSTLGELGQRLAKESFVRVHRSYLVNLDKVCEIVRENGSYVVVVSDRDETRVPVARRQARGFRKALGM